MSNPEFLTPISSIPKDDLPLLGFQTFGPTSATTVAVTHGWAADSEFTKSLIPLFPNFRIMLIDLPGYGRSAHLRDYCQDLDTVATLIAHTVPENTVLMSWSLSTLYAIRACALYKEHFKALITVCGAPRFPDEEGNPGFNQRYIKKLNESFNERTFMRLVRLFYSVQGNSAGGRTIAECFARFKIPPFEVLNSGILHMLQGDERAELTTLSIPVLHIFGRNDLLVPATQQAVLNRAEKSSIYTFENSAHLPFITEPDIFKAVIGEFIDNI